MGAALFFADGNHDKYELDVLNKVISRFEKQDSKINSNLFDKSFKLFS